MPAAAACVCAPCGRTFILSEAEMALHSSMRTRITPRQTPAPARLETWEDWLEHVATHCPQCRYVRPPSQCVRDRDKHQKRLNAEQAAFKQWEKKQQDEP